MPHQVLLFTAIALFTAITVAPARAQETAEREREVSGRRAAEDYFHNQRAYPFGRIPQNARLNALEQSREIAARSSRGGLLSAQSWRLIGPHNTGGRVNTIAVHPHNGDTLWIGAADGGVWKSTNAGASWKPVMDDANSLALGAIAVDPNQPNVLYAGTGEAAFNIDTYSGAGMYKSVDGGETWHLSGLTTVAAFSRIVVLPGTSTVIASAIRNNGGIYRSTDRGTTWTRVAADPVFDLTVNPINANEVFAGGGRNGVLRSTDGGVTFAPSGNGFAPDESYPGRVSVQFAPSDPSILYALSSEWKPPSENITRIYKSTDGGSSWVLKLDNDPNILNYYGFAQGSYNNVIAIHPTDANVVYAGGVLLLRTTDGGVAWELIGQGLHPDFHALAFARADQDRLYIATDGGMYSADGATTTFQRISQGLAITQFYGMRIDQRMADVTYGGTQDNGTISTTAEEYRVGAPGIVSGSDGFHVAVDRTNSDIVYVEHPYGEPFRVDLRTGYQLQLVTGLSMGEVALWCAPLVMNPQSSDVLYTGRRRVFRFDVQSSRWRAISKAFGASLSAIGVSPVDTSIIYAGSERGELRVTTDAGRTWQPISVGRGLPDRAITDIAPSPSNSCTAFISYSGFYSGHVFVTRDCGATWSDVSTTLPDIPVNALVIDPTDSNVVFAGTDIGVYATTDAGATWWQPGEGLPAVVVADLDLHVASRTLRAATHGRSMYELSIGDVTRERAVVAPAGGERWVGKTVRSIVWNADEPVRLEYSIDDGAQWHVINESLIGGAYRWSVPDVATGTARIRATSMSDSTRRAVSDQFTIEPMRPGIVVGTSLKQVLVFGLAFDGEVLWGSSEWGDTLVKIDPTTLSTIDFVLIRGLAEGELLNDIAFHPQRGTFFAHGIVDRNPQEQGTGKILEIDRAGTVVNRWPSPCVYPVGIAIIDDATAGVSLLVSDLFDDQAWYVVDDETGAVIREIPRNDFKQYGPMGMASGSARGSFWQVIGDFSIDEGPRGSTAVLMTVENQIPSCVFSLATSPDSTAVVGLWSWGRLFGHSIERDPRDDGFWVTNLDGTIFKMTGCQTAVSSARSIDDAHAAFDVVRIAPNPARTHTDIEITSRVASSVAVVVRDGAGRLVGESIHAIDAGTNAVRVDMSRLPSGVYAVSASSGSTSVTRRVVKIE